MEKTNDESKVIHDFLDVLGKSGNHAAKMQNYNNNSEFQHIYDKMRSSFKANLPFVDMAPGSVISTMLEVIAQSQQQFQQDTIKMIQDMTLPPKKGPRGCK